MLNRLVDALLDPTIALSFDRTGYLRHSRSFEPADLDVDLRGRVILVTGANSGIGRATAAALAARGATLYLLCRDPGRGQRAEDELRAETGSGDVHFERVDLSSFASIRAFSERFDAPRIDALVHNAGVLPDTRKVTDDGLELTLATNLVGPFLLTWLLLPRLDRGSKIIHVSSGGMYGARLPRDLNRQEGAFDGVQAYAVTKRAQVILTELLAERLSGRGIVVQSMHPGWAETPAVQSSLPRFYKLTRSILRSPEQGADTVIWLVACGRSDATPGRFWFDRAPRRTHLGPWTRERPGARAHLWSQLCDWIGIEEDAI